jgi:putative transposase
MLASLTRQELARQVQFLKTENRILRSKLPARITVTPEERRRLITAGRKLGTALRELITIVQPATFVRWLAAEQKPAELKKSPRKPGRPRTPQEIEEIILRLARDTGWGYTRIWGELKKLRIRGVTRQTVKNILKRNDLDPGPQRGKGSWDEFLKIHGETLWQCDFLSKKVWTLSGFVDLCLLVFIHVGSRRIWISAATQHPDSAWVAQQARNFCMHLPDAGLAAQYVMHDADTKFTQHFKEILQSEGATPLPIPFRGPNLNAFAERIVQTLKVECLDHFVVCGERHLNHIVAQFADYYHHCRPHQSLGNRPPLGAKSPAMVDGGKIVCEQRLGGLLKHYVRRAA